MNRNIKVIIATFFVFSTILTPFALAKPWDYPKNNEKFQNFSAVLAGTIPNYVNDFKPNEENPNVIVQSWGNNIVDYEIVIGEKHYFMGDDFLYDQYCVHTSIGAPFFEMLGIYVGSKSNHMRIKYEFDFSAVEGGIDGTLEMLSVSNNQESTIRSLRGTGDLQNVQIMATAPTLGTQEGIVSGWPE